MTDSGSEYPTETPNEIIHSPSVRRQVYRAFAVVALALAATNAGYGIAISEDAVAGFPLWLLIADGVFPIITAGFGYTAQRNVPRH